MDLMWAPQHSTLAMVLTVVCVLLVVVALLRLRFREAWAAACEVRAQ